ncbi:hypothetical protein K438DRAFT_447838 [Mycena galopus ATCC 62051]|nr:hypothetical protein K438DRAFT_447838 [Mycena galopus ATCC 62051]
MIIDLDLQVYRTRLIVGFTYCLRQGPGQQLLIAVAVAFAPTADDTGAEMSALAALTLQRTAGAPTAESRGMRKSHLALAPASISFRQESPHITTNSEIACNVFLRFGAGGTRCCGMACFAVGWRFICIHRLHHQESYMLYFDVELSIGMQYG